MNGRDLLSILLGIGCFALSILYYKLGRFIPGGLLFNFLGIGGIAMGLTVYRRRREKSKRAAPVVWPPGFSDIFQIVTLPSKNNRTAPE